MIVYKKNDNNDFIYFKSWVSVSLWTIPNKNKGSYELGLSVFLKNLNQNMSSPYTKDALLYKLFIRIILIRIIFDVYYILIFDSG